MALITLEQLKNKLDWQRVFEEREEAGYTAADGTICSVRSFAVQPEREDLPYISFIFDDAVSSFGPLCFGPWHWDPYHPDSEIDKVREAIRLARRLMSHYFCVAEDLNTAGDCRAVGLYRPDEIPRTLGKDITQFRRWFFGKDSVTAPVDRSRYVEGEHVLIERRYDAQMARAKMIAQKMLDEKSRA